VKKIETLSAPAAIGPYSQAIHIPSSSQTLYVSGQLPIIPETGQLITVNIAEATHRVLKNIEAILNVAGFTFDDVVRSEVFLQDLNHFPQLNAVYQEYFKGPNFPARQTIQVAKLPLGAMVEISCIAVK
jgi:2-iminobutanoate/2-iminopropanoate deaminase